MARRSHIFGVMLLSIFLLLSALAVAQQTEKSQQPSPASRNPQSPEKATPGTEQKSSPAENATPNKKANPEAPAIHNDVVIKGATVLTVTHGRIENGSVYVHNGKIAAVGKTVNAPASATVIDASRASSLGPHRCSARNSPSPTFNSSSGAPAGMCSKTSVRAPVSTMFDP